jgi:Tfp pilus assembly protein PilX
VHYIDDQGNVYDTEDIMKNAAKPRIIAKYLVSLKNGENVYSIEE